MTFVVNIRSNCVDFIRKVSLKSSNLEVLLDKKFIQHYIKKAALIHSTIVLKIYKFFSIHLNLYTYFSWWSFIGGLQW